MKLSPEEFRKLQIEWYDKLKESGFKDIEKLERDELVLKRNANWSDWVYRHELDEITIKQKENFFIFLSQFVEDENTLFSSEIDKYILCRYAEGAKIKEIVSELTILEMPKNRFAIRRIIKKYVKEWQLKK